MQVRKCDALSAKKKKKERDSPGAGCLTLQPEIVEQPGCVHESAAGAMVKSGMEKKKEVCSGPFADVRRLPQQNVALMRFIIHPD